MIVKIVNKSQYPTPKYATPLSAGMDINANIDSPIELKSLERAMIPTGLYIELPQGYEAQIRPRSGLAAKYGVTVANAPGTIDADYRGEIKVILVNLSKDTFIIKPGERIAQMVIAKYQQVQWSVVEKLTDTLRGEGGFGSTGLSVKANIVSVSKIANKNGKPDIFKLYVLYQKCKGICTDTREDVKGKMFFALKGDNFDGNNFIIKALEKGASYVIADNKEIANSAKKLYPEKVIWVDDVLKTFQLLAKHHRLQYKIPVIALTGTNGKTTTKELINCVLSAKYKVVATEGNLNNDIGVPITLFRINKETEVAVIEMGASHPNDIAKLVSIVCPSFGLITNVGKAHIQGFGSLDGVKKAKGELYDNLQEYKKIAFVNIDNENLMEMVTKRPNLQIVPYGINNNCANILESKSTDPFLKIEIPDMSGSAKKGKMVKVKTKLIGNYNVDNVLAALTIATHFDVSTQEAVKAIANYIPSNNRSQMEKSGSNTIIKDTYNANPTSMTASIESFSQLKTNGDKVLILGDMLELGKDSLKEHKNIISLALNKKPKKIFFVGDEFANAYKELYNKRASCIKLVKGKNQIQVTICKKLSELKELLKENKPKRATILVKGSHGIHLEEIFDLL